MKARVAARAFAVHFAVRRVSRSGHSHAAITTSSFRQPYRCGEAPRPVASGPVRSGALGRGAGARRSGLTRRSEGRMKDSMFPRARGAALEPAWPGSRRPAHADYRQLGCIGEDPSSRGWHPVSLCRNAGRPFRDLH